jgi:hypothetical protein
MQYLKFSCIGKKKAVVFGGRTCRFASIHMLRQNKHTFEQILVRNKLIKNLIYGEEPFDPNANIVMAQCIDLWSHAPGQSPTNGRLVSFFTLSIVFP